MVPSAKTGYPSTGCDSLMCDICKKSFHVGCTTFEKSVYATLKEKDLLNKEVFWKCSSCKNEDGSLGGSFDAFKKSIKSNDHLMDNLFQLNERLNNLEMNSGKTKSLNSKKSCIEIQASPVVERTTHQVIVSLDDEENLTEQTFADKVKSNLSSVPITSLKVMKDGHGIINFPDKSSRDVGLSNLTKDFKAEPNNRPARMLLPKVSIFGIQSSDYKSTDHDKLKKAICDKNPSLKSLIESGKVFDILFIKEDWKRNGVSFAAVKVDKEIYTAIQELKKQIYIDFSRCYVRDRVRVTQCYRCQQFGHVSSNCASSSQACRYCSGCHSAKDCPFKSNPGKYKCANCKLNHTSTFTKCSIMQSQVDALVKRTQGMEALSKNDLRPSDIIT